MDAGLFRRSFSFKASMICTILKSTLSCDVLYILLHIGHLTVSLLLSPGMQCLQTEWSHGNALGSRNLTRHIGHSVIFSKALAILMVFVCVCLQWMTALITYTEHRWQLYVYNPKMYLLATKLINSKSINRGDEDSYLFHFVWFYYQCDMANIQINDSCMFNIYVYFSIHILATLSIFYFR